MTVDESNLMDNIVLPARWTPLRAHPVQTAWMNSKARFNVVPAGRRSGKTERAKRKLVMKALSGESKFPDPRYFAGAPTRQQAKDIWWLDIKRLIPSDFIEDVSESELRVKLITGASITVVGLDKPQRIEGQPWDGGILDEYANIKAEAWAENIRPALSDRKGFCDFIGVPEGRNHYYEMYEKALNGLPGWAGFTWKSIDILDAEEVASARAEMDEMTFNQEYEASFLSFQGRAYYAFDRTIHASPEVVYNPKAPLILCFDFNVSPGICGVLQESAKMPNGLPGTMIIDEVYIPNNSNTELVCNRIIHDWAQHKGQVHLYGDATGGNSGSAKLSGSDWDIIMAALRPVFGTRLVNYVTSSNPIERARVNSFNTRLKKADGTVNLMIHPENAKQTLKDLEGVRVLEGGSGELDKKSDPKLTHLSDAIGYYIHQRWPVAGRTAPRSF